MSNLYQQTLEYFRKEEIDKCLESFEKAINRIQDKKDSIKLLNLLTDLLNYSQKKGDKTLEAEVLKNLGRLHAVRKDFTQGLQSYQKARIISKELGDKKGEAEALEYMAADYAICGKLNFAVNFYRQALNLYKELDHRDKIDRIAWEIQKIEEVGDELDRNEYLMKKFHLERK